MDERSKAERYAALEKAKRERVLSGLFGFFHKLSGQFIELEETTEGKKKLFEDMREGLRQLLELEGFDDWQDLKIECQQALIKLQDMSVDEFLEEESLKYSGLIDKIFNFLRRKYIALEPSKPT